MTAFDKPGADGVRVTAPHSCAATGAPRHRRPWIPAFVGMTSLSAWTPYTRPWIPAFAGVTSLGAWTPYTRPWIPAFAGMTTRGARLLRARTLSRYASEWCAIGVRRGTRRPSRHHRRDRTRAAVLSLSSVRVDDPARWKTVSARRNRTGRHARFSGGSGNDYDALNALPPAQRLE